ncbi:MAG: NAD(P)-dependent oxidoreductase [Alphaproteobacteria bacterium]|nr:NAD(P)-dependent oxidoreductase [Alphaproteobacteria bacterium]
MASLIIGAGLVGSQVARILVERGERPVLMDPAPQPEALGEIVDLARVTLIDGDVLRPLTLSNAIVEHGIADIVHTAANPMLTVGAQRDPYAAIQLNIMGTVNVLEAARVHRLKRVIVSSSNVLNHYLGGGDGDGDPASPLKEEAFPRPTTFYATTKQAIENLGLNYARWSGIDFGALRYGAVMGPWSGRGGGGPSNVFREAIRAALDGREGIVPPSAMEWVYSKDAGLGTVLALKAADLRSRIFNCTMGRLVTGEELAAAIREAIPGARTRIETPAATAVSMTNMRRVSDLSLAKAALAFTPQFGLKEAVRDMAEWLKRHGKK